MNPRVRKVRPLPNYRLEIEFENAEIREFDLELGVSNCLS
jgi:hypothetical protein